MRTSPLILSIILVLLVVALYYCSYMEGFETLAQKVSDRFNPLAALQNPITNPAVRIGISEADGAKLRDMNITALNVSNVTPGSSIVETFSDLIYPRIDTENSYLGLIKMCKEKGVGDRPFDDPQFADTCGMCVTSGSLKTGETFTTPTGVLVYPNDKLAALNDKVSNAYPFPPVVPSIDAAVCKGASRSSTGEPSLAITQADFDAFKARMECKRSHGFGNGCAKCITTKESSWISPTGGIKSLTLFLYGVGSVVVTLGGTVVSQANAVLSDKVTKVSLGKAAEGTTLNITVSNGVATEDPYIYGALVSQTPSNKPYILSIERILETDKVSGGFVRKAEPMVISELKVTVSKLLPNPTKNSMALDGFIPLTLVDADQLAAYDCKAGPYVSSQASAELFITDPCQNPKGQGPGKYSRECLQNAVTTAGCSTNGDWYKNPDSGNAEIGAWTAALKAQNESVGGTDPIVSMGCRGINIGTPCDAYKNGGIPNKQCMQYLYSNNSENSQLIGRAYNSANTTFTSRNQKQFQFCQPTGSLNPNTANGLATLQGAAAGYGGLSGIEAVRKFLSDIFMKATSDLNINMPDSKGGRKDSWEKCIGLPIVDVPVGKVSLNSKSDVLTGRNTEYDYTMGGDWIYENKKRIPIDDTITLSGGVKVHAATLNNFTRLVVTDKDNKHITARAYEGPISQLESRVSGGDDFSKLLSLPDATGHYILYDSEGKPFDSVSGPNYSCRFSVDHFGDDINCSWGSDTYMGYDLKAQCDADPNCKAYNTLVTKDGKHGGCTKSKMSHAVPNSEVTELCVKKVPKRNYTCGVIDHDGDDIKCVWGFDSYIGDELEAQCNADPNCKSYNTIITGGKHAGCLKHKSNPTNTNGIVKELCVKN